MPIKTKNKTPGLSDFSSQDLIINTKEGSLFYKSEKGIHKLSDQPSYQLQNFAANLVGSTEENFIPWYELSEAQTVGYHRQLLIPFDGIIHKLFFKLTGITPTTTFKLYKNIKDQGTYPGIGAINGSPIKTVTHANKVGTGDGGEVGNMNVVVFNKKVKAGDHISITMQPIDGIHEIFGQLLTSQDVTI